MQEIQEITPETLIDIFGNNIQVYLFTVSVHSNLRHHYTLFECTNILKELNVLSAIISLQYEFLEFITFQVF